ncbi:MAG TPA: hypothetical protein VMS76_03310 [Planctomycetota bacterium]|nr:hypothetical protein [Planctomycetota bacterium]
MSLPRDGHASLQLDSLDGGRPAQTVYFAFERGALVGEAQLRGARAGELWVKGLIAGRHRMSFELLDAETELVRVPLPDGSHTYQRPPYFRTTRELALSAGETHVLDL